MDCRLVATDLLTRRTRLAAPFVPRVRPLAYRIGKSNRGGASHRRGGRLLRGGLIVLGVLALSSGCVRRRLTVRTSPPGALVSVDNQVIGTTPAATPFVYYGTREIRVVKDGYRTETLKRRLNPPWYQWPGIDFIAETLWPWEIRDERIIDVELVPREVAPMADVLQRADQLRSQSRQGVVTAAPPAVGEPPPAPATVPIDPGPIDPGPSGLPVGGAPVGLEPNP